MVIVEPGGTCPLGDTPTTVSLGTFPWPFDSCCFTTKPSATRRRVASRLFKPTRVFGSTNTVGPAVVEGATDVGAARAADVDGATVAGVVATAG